MYPGVGSVVCTITLRDISIAIISCIAVNGATICITTITDSMYAARCSLFNLAPPMGVGCVPYVLLCHLFSRLHTPCLMIASVTTAV